MKLLPLVWSGLWRYPLRTLLVFTASVCAFVLFTVLQGRLATANDLGKRQHTDLLVSLSRFGPPMPISYEDQIGAVPGVAVVVRAGSFLGRYQNDRVPFLVLAGEPIRAAFELFPERVVAASALQSWLSLRTGAIAAQPLAQKYGWKVGDLVAIQSNVAQTNGGTSWQLQLVGTFEPRKSSDANVLVMRYDYFDEARAHDRETATQFVSGLSSTADSGRVSAAIDALFRRSNIATRTFTERELAENILQQFGNLTFFVGAITAAVVFTLSLLVATAMQQSVYGRLPELALLKTVGYSDRRIQGLLLLEAAALLLVGAVCGLAAGTIATRVVAPDSIEWGSMPRVVAYCLTVAAVIAVGSCVLPGRRLQQMSVADVLHGR